MRRFLTKITLFSVLATITIAAFWCVLIMGRNRICRTDANILVCGNSTVEYGVDDRILRNCLNVGFNAELPEFILAKVKMMKRVNPQIDTLLVGIDDALLFKNTNEGYHSDLHHFYYYDQLGVDDLFAMWSLGSLDWLESYLSRPLQIQQIVTMFRTAADKKAEFKGLGVGGYYELDKNELRKELENHADSGKKREQASHRTDVCQLTLNYIKKIERFCADNGIELIFFTTPKHSFSQTHAYRDICAEYFPGNPLLDFTDLALPDSCFADTYHINTAGASLFTTILADALVSNR